ncbi:DUF4266 domain-containing protein [Paraglaciecola polaris]|uniref:DUF4266 domain-containing protein n=1 Tax=Paraglaciecola polaris LMG 21857 TaxID=1129793 RepID=K6ZCX4_9ALTE|nr:hypothetical protein GPLA_3048 [Paraglaciecola polaris LMG 21857]|tara:strand:- start:125106 stop:125342 length:237 start_codon:yes stop_codon:yes gene_type:complete
MRNRSTNCLFVAIIIMGTLTLNGCANIGVKPWQRDLLAKDEMALDAQGIDLGLDDHIYFSKEATSGGRSFAGGGCGCN